MTLDYSQTYLYKLHKLTNSLDKVFDQNLRRHADIGLSQFTLLLSVDQHQPVSQRVIAEFLDISPGAVSRQTEIAQKNGWVSIDAADDRRQQMLQLTSKGKKAIANGLSSLEQHVFHIFDSDNEQTNLMQHVDTLLENIQSVNQQAYGPLKGDSMSKPIPKAADLFQKNGRDINKAVTDVQKNVGIHINESWWKAKVGAANNDLATAKRFDAAYGAHVLQIRASNQSDYELVG